MRKYIFLVVIGCLLAFGCKSLKGENSTCDVKLSFQDNYRIVLPCYKRKNLEVEYHGERQYTFYYKNGYKFFVSNDIEVAPMLLSKHLSEKQSSSFVFNETLSYEGENDTDNTWWRVVKKEGLLLGYVDVPKEQKTEFDRAISSISKE